VVLKFGDFITNFDRITQPVSDFIRGNPIVSTAAVGIGTTGLVTAVARTVRKRKKKKTTKRRRKAPKKRSKRKVTRRRKKPKRKARRKIIRGRGLGTKEIRHSGKSTKGKFKLVSFRDKKTGKMVRFKARK